MFKSSRTFAFRSSRTFLKKIFPEAVAHFLSEAAARSLNVFVTHFLLEAVARFLHKVYSKDVPFQSFYGSKQAIKTY